MASKRALSVLPALLTASVFAPAQTTFHTGTSEVLVNATVSDRKGVFARDLARSDFHLFEDGKEQPITSFALARNATPETRNAHFIALAVESEWTDLRERLLAFIDQFSAPDVYVALYSLTRGELRLRQPFTTDAERLKEALRAMPHLTANDLLPPRQGKPLANIPAVDRVSRVAAELAPIHGHKALILFSGGAFASWSVSPSMDRRQEDPRPSIQPLFARNMQKVVDDCVTAGVSVYAFAVGKKAGLKTGDFYGEGGNRDIGGSTDLIRDLAIGTGGRYTPPGTYDLARYLGSVIKQQDDYYLLGYATTSDSDKPCHKIKVKVDRPALDVKARDEYCTTGPTGPRGFKAAHRSLETRLANLAPRSLNDVTQISWFHLKPNAALVDIDLIVDPAAMKRRGRSNLELDLLGVAYREDGSVAARIPDTVTLEFGSPAQRDDFLKAPYHYANQFALPPGHYRFVLAAGSEEQTFGVAEKALDIEPWSTETLSISSIVLGIKDHAANDVAAEFDASLTDGPHRLVSNGRELEPMGSARFASGRDGMFYVEVYDPRPANLALTARILDRASNAEQANSGPIDAAPWMRPGRSVIPTALTLPVAKLPPGAYTLEVRCGGAARTRDFEVE